MNTRRIIAMVVLIVGTGLALLAARAHHVGLGGKAVSTRRALPRETVTVAADEPIPNVPGKRLVSRIVDYPPGGVSVPHRHARSAFIYAHVLSGRIRSQVNDGPVRVYGHGEMWFESPGSHHR